MESTSKFFIEIGSFQKNKYGQLVCGDTFLSKKIMEENRYVAVLSDGLGSGVKANVLSTMTASMALNFRLRREPIIRTAQAIMNTLPIDAERNISYSTFTIADIDIDGEAKIAEYDNPSFLLVRNGAIVSVPFEQIKIETNNEAHAPKRNTLRVSQVLLEKGDRLIFYSDGVNQSGIGNPMMPFGWSDEGVIDYVQKVIAEDNNISARDLARKIVVKSEANDVYLSKDDTSCAVVYVRHPRKLLICTGPPFNEAKDKYLGEIVKSYDGKKILCGGTTSLILSRELNKEIETSLDDLSSGLPPVSYMEGIDLITEGILTLGGLVELLENNNAHEQQGKGPAYAIFKLLMESDLIDLVVGTRINVAHQDPSLPVELEIRRNVVKRIAYLLEEKFLKKVILKFV